MITTWSASLVGFHTLPRAPRWVLGLPAIAAFCLSTVTLVRGQEFDVTISLPENLTKRLKQKHDAESVRIGDISLDGRTALFTSRNLLQLGETRTASVTTLYAAPSTQYLQPRLSPDSTVATAPLLEKGGKYRLLKISVSSQEASKWVRFSAGSAAYSLSDDASRVAFLRGRHVYVASGAEEWRITENHNRQYVYWHVLLSGDGRRVLYVRALGYGAQRGELCLAKIPTGEERVIDEGVLYSDPPTLSHDGATVAYIRGGKPIEVVVHDLAAGARKSIGRGRQPNLSRSGRLCAYVDGDGITVYDVAKGRTFRAVDDKHDKYAPLKPVVMRDEKGLLFVGQGDDATEYPRERSRDGKIVSYAAHDVYIVRWKVNAKPESRPSDTER